jgi:hypothetical protein
LAARAASRKRDAFPPLKVAAALDVLTPTAATFNGGNASLFREAALAANGFDNGMGYGTEERALGERLEDRGI